MKPRVSLKFMLKATFACILLTLVGIGFRYFSPIRIGYFDVFEGIAAWIAVGIGWAVYFLDLFRIRRKKHEDQNDEKAG